ncbi:MAG: class I SAM-dependent methyltransferase [Planctomycetota bacterium]|jgi:SAM-dependent methyltransferase
MAIDFGRYSEDYARHRTGPPASFYDRLAAVATIDGATVVDVGTGPGIVALELARRGARVTGVDVAPRQIEAARRGAEVEGLAAGCRFVVAPAEATTLDDDSCDLFVASQCWIWLDAARTLAEARRVLRAGGHVVIVQFDYVSRDGGVTGETERLILRHNPGWTLAGKDGLYPGQVRDLETNGFTLVEQFCYDHAQPFTHEGWRGRMRTCNGVGSGGLTDEAVERFDADLADLLRRRFPDDPLPIPHRVWAVVARPGDGPA